MDHYKLSEDFCKHQTTELILKLYALLKTFDSNFKFRGFMKKKTEDMKRHYYMQSNVSALCTNEEIEIFKQTPPEEIPEETTIFTFLADIVRAVEVINNEGTCTWAYYPKHPKVFYLTQNSLKNFRAECRIDQATTKVMDLMAYVKQFDIEMTVNYHLNQKYSMLAVLLSDDAFDIFKQVLWMIGLFINFGVIMCYEMINGKFTATPGYESQEKMIFLLSFMQAFWSFSILCLWFMFRFESIREIEHEKFLIRDPGVNAETFSNKCSIYVYYSIICQAAPLNFLLHF